MSRRTGGEVLVGTAHYCALLDHRYLLLSRKAIGPNGAIYEQTLSGSLSERQGPADAQRPGQKIGPDAGFRNFRSGESELRIITDKPLVEGNTYWLKVGPRNLRVANFVWKEQEGNQFTYECRCDFAVVG